MGARKRIKADAMKEAKKKIAFAKLNNCPTSPRKMRLVADLIRGMDADKALAELKLNPKEASGRMEKLLLSALANWEAKNEGQRMDEANLYVSEVRVDGGRMLKRVQPAPQGRAHRIRKRSNHVTLVVDSRQIEAINNMGQKTNPIGNRLGIIRGWDSNWYGGNDFGDKLAGDAKIRKYLRVRLARGSVSKIAIERTLKLVTLLFILLVQVLLLVKVVKKLRHLKRN